MTRPNPTCFISYSHDSEAHKQAVVELAQVLREQHGIDVMIDRFVEHQPPAYWPQWMVQQIEQSDFVIVVVTETYAERFKMQQEDPRVGRGVTWEGAVINSHVYSNFGRSSKFIPIVFNENDRAHIPFPLSETSSYVVPGLEPQDLEGLLRQLNQVPVVVPAPLGQPSTSVPDEISAALSLATTDKEAAMSQLRDLTHSTNPAVAGTAAFHLGELQFADDQPTASIQSFRFAMEFGNRSPVFERAQEALLHALGYLNSLFGEGSARAAVWHWLALIRQADIAAAWQLMERDVRLALAQDWILANADHPNLSPYNRDELAADLSALTPQHELAAPFLASQLGKFQSAYGHIDEENWGSAERRRVYNIEYELVIMVETKGEHTRWESGTWAPTAALVMRRQTTEWLVAGFDGKIAHPGWPPTFEDFPTGGIVFDASPPSPNAGDGNSAQV
ncbi:hypothetical protein BAB79_06695 [Mycobacteroides abscessus]|nr:hypothetical protein A3O06_06700 [Mycobacteroides abscessus]ANO23317.1 hypothetical protein BAB79_06695 [Mycobacteroides abscessus]